MPPAFAKAMTGEARLRQRLRRARADFGKDLDGQVRGRKGLIRAVNLCY